MPAGDADVPPRLKPRTADELGIDARLYSFT